jgi:hypothetical protein
MTMDKKSKTTKTNKEEVFLGSNILSLTSALPNWNAVYFDDDGSVWFEAIACYALCEKYDLETGKKYKFVGSVVSQDASGLTIAEDANNFLGISPPGETEIEWAEIAANKLGISVESEEFDEDLEDEDSEDEDSEDEDSEQVVEVVPKTRRRNLR